MFVKSLLFISAFVVSSVLPVSVVAKPLQRIAFGSCNFQLAPQDHWVAIGSQSPDLWIWLGDNIYSDYLLPKHRKQQYDHILRNQNYQNFVSDTPVIGTWDDHDYAGDSLGKAYRHKKESQALMLDFLGEPKASARRKQDGVYASHSYGEVPQRVKVLLLDVRYFRDLPGATSELLGETQWGWLESELAKNDSELILLGSGSQVLPIDHSGDKWQNYPKERIRLVRLLESTQTPVLLLSGDVHFAEFSETKSPIGKVLSEFTSSGLTHSQDPAPNHLRVGRAFGGKNFGLIDIDWEEKVLILSIMDVFGENQERRRMSF